MVDYPGRVAAIDVHYNPTDSFFLQEAYDRIHYYPPPYYGMYMSPWLWYDGNQHGGFDHLVWRSMILARMALPAPVTITIDGNYDPGSGNGNANIRFQNDSSATINGRVIVLITEDSLFYPAPNGQNWHNHVPRDYLPDHNGSVVAIPAGSYVDVNQPFSIDPVWNDDYCQLVAFLQNDVMQPDSTMEIWQGAVVDILEIGVEEQKAIKPVPAVKCYPNPGYGRIMLQWPVDIEVAGIRIIDASGRMICDLKTDANSNSIQWTGVDSEGRKVSGGVYFAIVENKNSKSCTKFILFH